MTNMQMPPRTTTADGRPRRIGFEFEFSGVGLSRSADIVQSLFGGSKVELHRFSYEVRGTRFGDFQIESDSSLLKNKRYEKILKFFGIDPNASEFAEKVEGWIESASEDLVPFEIVTPPLPITDIESVEDLRRSLMEAGAQGTHAHFYSAYGFQFNPEMPDFELKTLIGYMRAFFLLYDHLVADADVPIARRVLPFIDPFPEEYLALVLDPSYMPNDVFSFTRDYLEWNPTRNRPLDWLPLFAYLNRDLVMSYEVERHLIKPRPTLHYRLPSSLIDDPQWTIAKEWNKWIEVENLAADPEKIRKMSLEWQELHQPMSQRSESRWLKRSEEWVNEST